MSNLTPETLISRQVAIQTVFETLQREYLTVDPGDFSKKKQARGMITAYQVLKV